MLKNFFRENIIEAGCDEAGRGCLAGPVFAAAVILPADFYHPLLNDSKQVTPDHRAELRVYIEANAISYAVAKVDHDRCCHAFDNGDPGRYHEADRFRPFYHRMGCGDGVSSSNERTAMDGKI